MGAKWARSLSLLAFGLVVGLILGMSPVGAHVNNRMGHIFSHVKDKVGLTWVDERSEEDSESQKTRIVNCPDGMQAIGGGASVWSDGGFDEDLPVAIQRSEPIDLPPDPDGGTNSGWGAKAVETSPTDVEWSLTIKVYCANL
jgi:hypothetical protein